MTPGWRPSTIAFPSSRTTGEACSPLVALEPEVGTVARTRCLAPLSSEELCEVRRSLKGGSWNANMKLNNKMMSLAANPEGWCHTPGSPQHQQPPLLPCPFLTTGSCWGANLLKFIISELSAHKTQFITPAVHEILKFPKTVELGGSSYSSSMEHITSRQSDFLWGFFLHSACCSAPCVLGRIRVGMRLLLLMCIVHHSYSLIYFLLYI